MKNTVLITGASQGLGEEFAKLFAADRYNLFLVARREDKLQQVAKNLQENYGVETEIFVCDLSEACAAEKVFAYAKEKDIEISALVNNAGFGDFGRFVNANEQKLSDMITLNVLTLTKLTRLFLPQMTERKQGKILNVASIASFEPGPLMSVYYATKAYVLSFTEGLAVELKGTGVIVSAICPGPTKTGFGDRAKVGSSGVFQNLKDGGAEEVAAYGYDRLKKGKVVSIAGKKNRWIVRVVKFAPRSLTRNLVYEMQKEKE